MLNKTRGIIYDWKEPEFALILLEFIDGHHHDLSNYRRDLFFNR